MTTIKETQVIKLTETKVQVMTVGTQGPPGGGIGGGAVDSVNSKTGAVVLTTADIADGTNKRYVTDAEKALIGNQTNVSGNAGTVTSIANNMTDGVLTTLSGSGTAADPYSVDVMFPTSDAWGATNVTAKKTFNAAATSLSELANVVGTLIDALKTATILEGNIPVDPSPSLKPVIILIGQSNAVGVGTISSAPTEYQGTITGAKIWNGSAFVNLVAGSTNQGADSLTFGPELSLCKKYLERSGNTEVYLIKHALSNTSLNVDWLPTSGAQYTAMVAKINAALSNLGTGNYSIKGFVWVQGENDALSASATPSINYQTNLTSLISNLRTAYGASLPFVAAQLGYINRNLYYYQDNVRNAQNLVQAAGVSVYVAQTDDLSFNADVIHYNAASQITLGNRAAGHLVGDVGYIENLPPAYSDIKFWFDPATPNTCFDGSNVIVTAGGSIQYVLGRQLSPLINVTQTNAANKPTVQTNVVNGRQAARFDGTNDQLFIAGVNPSQMVAANAGTIFLIQKYAVDKAAASMYINAGANSILQTVNKWKSTPFDDIFWDFANQSTGRIYGTAPAGITGNWKLTEFVKRASGVSEVFVGGTSAISGSTSGAMASATGTLRIGTDGSNFFNGDIAEIICYNKELSTTERNAVYAYINEKYGL